MRIFKRFEVLTVAVLALSAIGAANASAAQFTASATGFLGGKATATQTFTTNGGQIKCAAADISGFITQTASYEQEVEVAYTSCTAFGFAFAHVSPAAFNLTANGRIQLRNTVTIEVTFAGCKLTLGPQTRGFASYATSGTKLAVTPGLSNLEYSSTGGLCGSPGSNGTYTGASEIERVGGGSLAFHP